MIGLKALALSLALVVSSSMASAEIAYKFWGINYNARRQPTWMGAAGCSSEAELDYDLALVAKIAQRVRIYSLVDCESGLMMLKAAPKAGLPLWLGMWVNQDPAVFQTELNYLKNLIENQKSLGIDFKNVIGIQVGSEAIYRKEITADQAAEYVKTVKSVLQGAGINILVTCTDIGDVLVRADLKPLIDAVDIVSANGFPYWEGIAPESGMDYFIGRMSSVAGATTATNGKKFLIGETGWPDNGGTFEPAAVTTPEAQKHYYQEFGCKIGSRGWDYFWFAAFDEAWKLTESGEKDGPEAHWGVYYANRTIKPWFEEPLDCTKYPTSAPPTISPNTSTSNPSKGSSPSSGKTQGGASGGSAAQNQGSGQSSSLQAEGADDGGMSPFSVVAIVIAAIAFFVLIAFAIFQAKKQQQARKGSTTGDSRTGYDPLGTPAVPSATSPPNTGREGATLISSGIFPNARESQMAGAP